MAAVWILLRTLLQPGAAPARARAHPGCLGHSGGRRLVGTLAPHWRSDHLAGSRASPPAAHDDSLGRVALDLWATVDRQALAGHRGRGNPDGAQPARLPLAPRRRSS